MSPFLALLIFVVGIGGLFYLDRDNSAKTSKALWLSVVWFWLAGSRSVSVWMGMSAKGALNTASTNPLDEFIAAVLMVSGIIVIAHRKNVFFLLRRSWPIVLYFSFCLASILWADFPGQGFKRWIRALGDIVMVIILATDPEPTAALKRFLARVGFLLLPLSILFIKYYPELGRTFDEYGTQVNAGVMSDKNMLGVVLYVVGLGTVWQILELLRNKKHSNRTRHLVAQFALLYFVISLLFTAHSATSGASFTLGVLFMVVSGLRVIRRSPAMVHAVVLTTLLVGGLTVLLGGEGAAAQAMGRDSNLTGRTDVWALVIPMVPNPIVGAGFENFWFGPRLEKAWQTYHGVNEAHDGYIEVYLNLGIVGVCLIALIFINGYRRAVGVFRYNPAFGGLLVAYILTAAIYNITEAGFRMLHPIWFFLLYSVVAASTVRSEDVPVGARAKPFPSSLTGRAQPSLGT